MLYYIILCRQICLNTTLTEKSISRFQIAVSKYFFVVKSHLSNTIIFSILWYQYPTGGWFWASNSFVSLDFFLTAIFFLSRQIFALCWFWLQQSLFSTVTGMRLCFRFVLNTGLMIEIFLLLLSRVYTEPRPLLIFTQPPWEGSWGYMAGQEETQPAEVTQADQRNIPDYVISYSV